MRAVTTFITGVFFITLVVFVAGLTMEPLLDIIQANQAVQAMGWGTEAEEITDTVLRWSPLAGLFFFVTWSFLWAIRREKRTSSAFRPKR